MGYLLTGFYIMQQTALINISKKDAVLINERCYTGQKLQPCKIKAS